MRRSDLSGRRPGGRLFAAISALIMAAAGIAGGFGTGASAAGRGEDSPVILRIANWEEYIDLGDWDEEETIELESGDIIGENSMVEDFEEWYEETYGIKVKVEYSTFGTNEDLYNMLSLGDEYDLVCPSEYMIMKLMREGKVVPLSEQFFDPSVETNYYVKGVSPYIRKVFDEHEIDGMRWSDYAAGYMWGVTGIVYNPEVVSREEASTWKILGNPKFSRQVTIKDNVRDSYFAAVGALKADLLTSEEFRNDPNYAQRLEDLDQAEEDDFYLEFAVPEECTNIYFDGWIMLENGIRGDAAKQHAAEAFINFTSRPDNVVRNMYYIGYTSVISGGDDPTVFEYAQYNYEAEEDEEETAEYDLGYFFSGEEDSGEYIIETPVEQLSRQLNGAYPPVDAIRRSSIMVCFNEEQTAAINRMWINVRCFSIADVQWWAWIITAVVAAGIIYLILRKIGVVKKQ